MTVQTQTQRVDNEIVLLDMINSRGKFTNVKKVIIIPFSRMIVINPGTPYEQARKFGSMPRLEKKLNEYRSLSLMSLGI